MRTGLPKFVCWEKCPGKWIIKMQFPTHDWLGLTEVVARSMLESGRCYAT
jgi:hypothetical protein